MLWKISIPKEFPNALLGEKSVFKVPQSETPRQSMTISVSVALQPTGNEWAESKHRAGSNLHNSHAPPRFPPRWCLCWPGIVGTALTPATGSMRRLLPPPLDRFFTSTSSRSTRWELDGAGLQWPHPFCTYTTKHHLPPAHYTSKTFQTLKNNRYSG